jgi:DNA repair protein RecN (Recombination protein N)
MLTRLHIRNIALIEKAELDLKTGLTVLTGETGAGKSMLMDALALAGGARANASLLRRGATQGVVEASFSLAKEAQKAILPILDEAGVSLENNDEITLRRVLEAEKSNCFIDGMKVPQAVQKQVGDVLVDIHGQHEQQLLFKPSAHASLLDAFGGYGKIKTAVEEAYAQWKEVEDTRATLAQKASDRNYQLDVLRSFLDELKLLHPQIGEVDTLAEERQNLMSAEKNQQALQTALQSLSDETVSAINQAERALTSVSHPALESLTNRVAELATLAADVAADLEQAADKLLPDPERLVVVDERLFALKDCARKHKCLPDELPDTYSRLQTEFDSLNNAEESLEALEKQAASLRQAFVTAAGALTKAREEAATKLQKQIHKILAPLKMADTVFEARLLPREAEAWNASGAETVSFYVATNKGAIPAPLEKVASGGEASRLLLALKTVMYLAMPSRTLVFDEIDTGVGGAVADAVGENLLALADKHQVLTITHQPQVAAKGQHHLKIEKQSSDTATQTTINELAVRDARLDEIARMLSGKDVTEAARLAAASLLG